MKFSRWNELVRKIELWAQIHELNEQGSYTPVELQSRDAAECGGVYQLRQGFSRRIVIQVAVPKQGHLPVVLERIKGIAIGSVNVRAKIQKGLDSYQERDLQRYFLNWGAWEALICHLLFCLYFQCSFSSVFFKNFGNLFTIFCRNEYGLLMVHNLSLP